MSLLCLGVLLAFQTHASGEEGKAPEGYRLVWADEFDKEGTPDESVWSFERGFQRNGELQWYQKENAFCEDGCLVIEARREQVENPGFQEGSRDWRRGRDFAEFTSASLITRPEKSWTYGRFEIRAKIVAKEGLWPAIWTTGHGRWPHGGEIDIMEYYNEGILANVCWAGPGGRAKWDEGFTPLKELGGEGWDEEFHLWVMEWTPESITISLDGRVLNTTNLKDTVNLDGDEKSPFHEPQRLRLNLALGGQRGGDVSKTEFPSRYLVDYVRVYQRE